MPVYKTARFDVRPESVDAAAQAIRELVEHVRSNEPQTRLYVSMQDKVHPNRYTHWMIFEDAAAEERHRSSAASKRVAEALVPLVVGGVQFRDLVAVAST
jgi:quinol monooxygenase YgiN